MWDTTVLLFGRTMVSRSSVILAIIAVTALIAATRAGGLDEVGGAPTAIVVAAIVGALAFAPQRRRPGDAHGEIEKERERSESSPPPPAPAGGDTPQERTSAPALHPTAAALASSVSLPLETTAGSDVGERSTGSYRGAGPPVRRGAGSGAAGEGDEIRSAGFDGAPSTGSGRAARIDTPALGVPTAGRTRPTAAATPERSESTASATQSASVALADWALEDTGESPPLRTSDGWTSDNSTTSQVWPVPPNPPSTPATTGGRAGRALHRIEADLRSAIIRGELELQYQPLFELRDRRLAGFEALVRWRHPEHGIVWPDEFLPVAESAGLSHSITRWVLTEACRQVAAWRDGFGLRPVPVSVNVPGSLMSDLTLVATACAALDAAKLTPELLRLEVSERSVAPDGPATATLDAIANAGIGVYLADFGAGLSWLSWLRRHAIDAVKIDRSLVARLHEDAETARIVGGVVSMVHGLGRRVVAEGIQTPAQAALLEEIGCDLGQGYLFSRPLDAAYAHAMMAATPNWT